VSEAALKEIFTMEVRRLWRTEFRSLGRVPVYRDRRRKIWEAMRGWLRRQDGFKDVESLSLEWEFGPPPKGASAGPGAASVTGSPGLSAASARPEPVPAPT
jgi:hypothetical protein